MTVVNRNIGQLRRRGVAKANALAAQVRALFVTQIPGQEMLYLSKEQEARAFVTDPAPDLLQYPLISAEVGVTAPTALEVAQVYLNLGAQWRVIAAQLETARLGTINAIEASTTQPQIDAALASLETSVQSFFP